MTDIGHYKTFNSKTFHCHFDPALKTARALGPLPELVLVLTVEAQDETEAVQKIREAIGLGVFTKPPDKPS